MQQEKDTTKEVGVNPTEPGSLTTVSNPEETSDQFQDIKNQIQEILSELPAIVSGFIVYSGWFIYRYLLRASNRQELSVELQAWKEQLLGDKLSNK